MHRDRTLRRHFRMKITKPLMYAEQTRGCRNKRISPTATATSASPVYFIIRAWKTLRIDFVCALFIIFLFLFYFCARCPDVPHLLRKRRYPKGKRKLSGSMTCENGSQTRSSNAATASKNRIDAMTQLATAAAVAAASVVLYIHAYICMCYV